MVLSRRALLAAGVAAPAAGVGIALAGGVRAALVGAHDFADSRAEAGAFPKRLWGPTGEARTLAAPPRRIASTFLGADELLASLLPPERVVAVSAYADDPATSNCSGVYPSAIPRLRSDRDVETIIALEPELVCVAGFTPADVIRQLSGARLALFRWSRFDSFADITGELRALAAATGAEPRGAELADAIERLLADLAARLAGVRPVRVLYYDPPVYTMGRGTVVGEILTRAGGTNVVDALGIVGPGKIGIEAVLALEPEAIVMPHYADNRSALQTLQASAIWQEVPAVRAGRVHEIPGAWIATISHHAARGLAQVARLLHPDRF